MPVEMTLPVLPPFPVACQTLGLNGAWSYAQPVPGDFPAAALPEGRVLSVPGEVVMQGLPLDPEADFALDRVVQVPADWAGQAIRLRFGAVYSTCTVYADGVEVARHLGGFTPFDIDLTGHARAGQALRIGLRVSNASIADDLSYGSRYAGHPLAGVTRDVTLYALPPAHLTAIAVATLFDGDYAQATLRLTLTAAAAGRVAISLAAPDGTRADLGAQDVATRTVIDRAIAAPQLWDTDHPQLYTLHLRLDGTEYEVPVGFREVAVRNRQVHLNGRRIFLRGVNHHETHPLTGRADTARWAQTDVALFKAAHVNYIRTSHYPPVPELLDACDRAGILVEVEAPVCFAFGSFGHTPRWEEYDPATQQAVSDHITAASLEMVVAHGLHPSVALWSVANESQWCPPFARSSAAIHAADPTRPRTFNWAKYDDACRYHVEIANDHYPDAGTLMAHGAETRPVLLGEFAHLYCYNDRELLTDPGLRGRWDDFLERQWAEVLDLPNAAGGAIWAAVDDWFLLPQKDGTRIGRGYGAWGPIDGWRRAKPELAGMRRVFDPVHLPQRAVAQGAPVRLPVSNRWDATDFAAMRIDWQMGDATGRIALALPPGDTGEIVLPAPPQGARVLHLHFRATQPDYDRRFDIAIGAIGAIGPEPLAALAAPVAITTGPQGWQLGDFTLDQMGNLRAGDLCLGGPDLALIPRHVSRVSGIRNASVVEPLRNAATAWHLAGIEAIADGLRISGRYGIAEGAFMLTPRADGQLRIGYDFTLTAALAPWQTGLVLALPRSCDRLDWVRAGPGDAMPDDHIARATGHARAFRDATVPTEDGAAPAWPWSQDQTAQGTNDFRATRRNVLSAALTDATGRGIAVLSDGRQHLRASMDGALTLLHIFDHAGAGSEWFLRSMEVQPDLEPGDTVSGAVTISAVVAQKDRS